MNVIDTRGCEFGYEIIMVMPYVYFKKKQNDDIQLIGCAGTRNLYYFLEDDEFIERYQSRGHSKPTGVRMHDIHIENLDTEEFLMPPFKEYFSNQFLDIELPDNLIIISNKYNVEWGKHPINYLSLPVLNSLFSTLKEDHTIIYNRAKTKNLVNDNSQVLEFGDYELAKKHNVIDMNDIFDQSQIDDFNLFQFLVFSRSNKFVSVQGGTSIISSLFDGTNVIFAKNGSELDCHAYDNWYHKLSSSSVFHTNDEKHLIELVCAKLKNADTII